MNTLFLLILAPFFSFTYADELPEPYSSIQLLPFDNHGWFYSAAQLDRCFDTLSPKVVIEVGSWLGLSTRYMAAKLPKGGKLYAVDTWLGSWSPDEVKYFKNDKRLPYVYQLFLSNVVHAGLADVIVPIRMKSLEAAKALTIQADLIYIDAGHDTDSVYADVMTWISHLSKGGILCGDDWGWPTVRKGVIRAAKELNLQIEHSDNFWRLY